MKIRTVVLALALMAIAIPSLWAAMIVYPYAGLTPRGACSTEDVAAVRQVQTRYALRREYARRIVRTDFPYDDAEGTIKRQLKEALRQTVLTHVRSDAYLAASFCSRAPAHDGTNEVVSIPKIAAALAPVDNTEGRYLLGVCASLEAVNLRRSPEDIRATCARHTAIWDRRWKARQTGV